MSEDYNFLRSFTFNEKETKHLFQIAQVRLPFLSKDNEYLKIGNADGKYYKGSTLGDLTISIDGFIIKDNSKMSVSDTIDELVKIVNSDEPKRLVLDSLDDRYFLATFNGTQEYDATNLKYTPLTLNFDVPEAFARAISINGYSNIQYDVEGNLMLDSEFNNVDKFWKPFAYKIDEKYNGSSILQADFRTGYPVGATEHLTYLQVTPNSRRRIQDIMVGDKVSVSTYYRFKQLGVDLEEKEDDYVVATIHLDEWGGSPLKIKHTHAVDVKKRDVILDEFKMIGDIFEIKNEETTHINLTVGFAGLSLFEISKPMMTFRTTKNNISDIVYVLSDITLTENIDVYNNGTYRTPLLAEFTMNGESGFVGLINIENGGVLQFGDVEDVDGKEATKSENVVNLTFNGSGPTGFEQINSGFNTIYKRMVGTKKENLFTGSFDTKSIYYSAKPKYSNEQQPSNSWNGPSGVVSVKSPSSANRGQNFGFFLRGHFDDGGKVNQRGRLECSIMDNTDNPYLNLVLRNSSTKSNNIIIEGYYMGEMVWEKTILSKDVKTTRFEVGFVRRDTYIKYHVVEIKELGPNSVGAQGVVSRYKSHNFTYNLTEIDETPVYSLGVWCMRYSNSIAMEKMLLDDLQFIWYNSPNWTNVKNSFQDGDIVSIDVDYRLLFVNGVVNSELNAVGNEWDKFYIGLGKSTIQPGVSSWANRPLVNINVQDRFI